ncbi:Maf family protein [Candidatus Albibeggiatoa sp. nov. NOAA]|uniref:Maf family protein n=1 Tax=Candidatus Albibeggiatoa sp. nov. NOAA TaxID=3162724 RepID=UPI0032FC99E4|nr:Maf family nucleotide pyrophosphatase [Thiotrichaceae bacterium]
MTIIHQNQATTCPHQLVLASSSPYRKSVLERLHLPFDTFSPQVDETQLVNESATDLVQRLAELKARAAQTLFPQALVIGSDQVAVLGEMILTKPHTHDNAVNQLSAMSGKQVDFLTGLCLLNTETRKVQVDIVRFGVKFRELTKDQIENYLQHDKPYNCSGSFKSEGLGIALLERMIGSDPTAVIGLPLIRLVHMLEAEGVNVLNSHFK